MFCIPTLLRMLKNVYLGCKILILKSPPIIILCLSFLHSFMKFSSFTEKLFKFLSVGILRTAAMINISPPIVICIWVSSKTCSSTKWLLISIGLTSASISYFLHNDTPFFLYNFYRNCLLMQNYLYSRNLCCHYAIHVPLEIKSLVVPLPKISLAVLLYLKWH